MPQVSRQFLVLAGLLLAPAAWAGSSGYAVGLKAGVFLGAGIEGTGALIPGQLNLRLGYNFGKISFDEIELENDNAAQSGLDVSADFEFGSGQAFVDFYPFDGRFRLTTGLLANGNEVSGKAVCNDTSCEVEGETFFQGQSADISIKWSGAAPYVGLGFGNPVAADKGFGFMFDLGVAFQGSPNTRFRTDASGCDEGCEKEIEDELRREADDFDLLPVISLGVSYQF